MDKATVELRKLYEMLGTVLSAQYAEQIQNVCVAFYENGKASPIQVPEFKTEQEYEDFIGKVWYMWYNYKGKLYRDGLRAGAECQQNAVEAAFSERHYFAGFKQLSRFDITAVLDYLRQKVPHDKCTE